MNFYRKLILMFCCIFDYSPKAMKLTKQINKKINQNHWLKIVKTHHLNNENLGIQNFHWIIAVGPTGLELEPYPLICLCCQDLVKGEEECEVCGANGDL